MFKRITVKAKCRNKIKNSGDKYYYSDLLKIQQNVRCIPSSQDILYFRAEIN